MERSALNRMLIRANLPLFGACDQIADRCRYIYRLALDPLRGNVSTACFHCAYAHDCICDLRLCLLCVVARIPTHIILYTLCSRYQKIQSLC